MPSTISEDVCRCERNGRDRERTVLSIHEYSSVWKKRHRSPSCDRHGLGATEFLRGSRVKKSKRNGGNEAMNDSQRGHNLTSSLGCSISSRSLVSQQQVSRIGKGTDSTAHDDGACRQCWIQQLPQEILLAIFSYLPLATLFLVIPHVCKKWEALSMDWSLWKRVEHLRIKTMIVNTRDVRTLLRTIPKLKELELVMRNDTEEVLEEVLKVSKHLEILRLDRCNDAEPHTAQSILSSCPKLKCVTFVDTHFRSKHFYKCLAERFHTLERINISCTTKSEMDFFIDNLKREVPGMEFQRVSMMGKANGKQIYWGSILGLVIRPNPTSSYHRQHVNNEFPNYAF